MKNYRDQEDLKCCLNCRFSEMKILPDENELFCYEAEDEEEINVSYTGICDNFKMYGEKVKE
jgi:hypothetical protein